MGGAGGRAGGRAGGGVSGPCCACFLIGRGGRGPSPRGWGGGGPGGVIHGVCDDRLVVVKEVQLVAGLQAEPIGGGARSGRAGGGVWGGGRGLGLSLQSGAADVLRGESDGKTTFKL